MKICMFLKSQRQTVVHGAAAENNSHKSLRNTLFNYTGDTVNDWQWLRG